MYFKNSKAWCKYGSISVIVSASQGCSFKATYSLGEQVDDDQPFRPSSRIHKPPGGGSSFSFR